eukprot:779075-Pyramimonas_sp.AAC.1
MRRWVPLGEAPSDGRLEGAPSEVARAKYPALVDWPNYLTQDKSEMQFPAEVSEAHVSTRGRIWAQSWGVTTGPNT